MKKYTNLFYTRAFKCIVLVLIALVTWFNSGYITDMFTLQVTNRGAFTNVFTQPFSFSYEESKYVNQEIEAAIDYILDYSLDYSRDYKPEKPSDYEEYDYYMRLSNPRYRETVEYLEGLRGVNFAVVNHSTDIIISNIKEIHGAPTGTEVRQLFASEEHPFIIIRNCSNPYYEQDSLPGYVDHVRSKASEYHDSCDLYISFTEGLCFRESPAYYEDMHNGYSQKVFSLANKIILLTLTVTALIVVLVKVCGRGEKNGRVIPAYSDQLPTDIIILFLLTIIGSASALYHTSLYMIYKTSTIEDYGIGFRPETYAFRADITLVIIIYVMCMLLCKIKRQRLLGTLWSGSYLALITESIRKKREEKA